MAKKEIETNGGPNITKEQTVELFDNLANAEQHGTDARSSLGVLHKNAEKDHGLNSQGVKHVRRLNAMSPEKRADFLRTVNVLVAHLGLLPDEDLFDG